MTILTLIRMDIAFMARHRVIYAFTVVVCLYLAALYFVPDQYREPVIIFMVFNDVTGIGFFFVGALMLFEMRQGTLAALMVTPVSPGTFVVSRIISFLIVSVFFALVLFLVPVCGRMNPVHAIPGLLLASTTFTALGITVALYSQSVNGYLARSMAIMLPFAASYPDALGIAPSRLWYILPFKGTIMLYRTAYYPVDAADILLSYGSLIFWATVLTGFSVYVMTKRRSLVARGSR